MLPNKLQQLTLQNTVLSSANKLLKKTVKDYEVFYNKKAEETLEEVELIEKILIKAGWDKKMGGYTDHTNTFRHGYPNSRIMLKFFLKYVDQDKGIRINVDDLK